MLARVVALVLLVCVGTVLGRPGFAAAQDPSGEPWLLDALEPRMLDGERVQAWPARAQLDLARVLVGAPLAWTRAGTRGAGATVCVVDTGLDLGHRDFLDATGHTRVRWLLDLDADPRGVHEALEREGGAVWSGAELDDALARGEDVAPDWHGHGTAIASAAVGDDAPAIVSDAGTYAGVAPEAALVVVRALRHGALGFHDDDVVRAARFCVDARVSDPARTVVLLALGGHDGPHDGTSAYERAISGVVASGAAVVVAAGNDGAEHLHASARLVRDEVSVLDLRLPGSTTEAPRVAVVVRGAREVRARLPGGAASAWVLSGQASDDGALRVDAAEGGAHYVIARGALAAGDLLIEARGARSPGETLDAWLVEAHLGDVLFRPRFVGDSAVDEEQITIPATAEGVVSVGASVSRDFLAGEGHEALTLDADALGRAPFSSRGPRVDGAALPTVLAPGGWVVAARAETIDPSDPEGLFGGSTALLESHARGEDRLAVAGTSVSAALVAGAIALARSVTPAPIDERAPLAAAARPAAAVSLGPYTPETGSGVLDVPAYLEARAREDAAASTVELACTRHDVVPAARELHVVVRGGGTGRVRARTAGASWSGTRSLEAGYASVPVRVPPAPVGTSLVVEAELDGVVREACRVVVRDGPGTPLPTLGGGCRVGAARAPCGAGPIPVLVAALLVARLRRRRAVVGSRP